jgi:PleD family two-component response regulator
LVVRVVGNKRVDNDGRFQGLVKGRAMATRRQQQILIVEDDLDLSEMLNAYFSVQGYRVATVAWGKDAIEICQKRVPDLVVLDIRLPDIDGYEIARQLKSQRRTKDLPIIFLTEKRDRLDKLAGLELGVVDYITKPFDIQELRLRVRNVLHRAADRKTLDNPVTSLPEGGLVDEQLEELLKGKDPWALLVVKLGGLDKFRDRYGFVASDDVLRAVSLMVTNAMAETLENGKEDFVGHLGQHELVIVTVKKQLEPLSKRIRERIGASMDYFYPLKDRDKLDKDRLGLHVGNLLSTEGPFSDADTLKEAALKAPLKT